MRLAIFQKNTWKQIDWVLLLIVLCIVLYGVIAITSTTSDAMEEGESLGSYLSSLDFGYSGLQLIYFAIGLVAIVVLLILDYNNLRDFSNILYWISVALLLAVLLSENVRGISGWFKLGSRGFQPAELCKIVIIIVLAKEFAQRTEGKEQGIHTFRELFPIIWRFLIPFALIVVQPDWGTALVYVFVLIGMMFMAKTSIKLMAILGLGAIALMPLAWLFMADWQKDRFYSFLNPTADLQGSGFNVDRAKTVGGSGGLSGKGFFSEDLLTQQSGYLPESHTDFIFSSATEAVGFIGALILIVLYLLLILRFVQLSTRAKDDFGMYIIIGVSAMFLFHIFENIGMNIGTMPVTGIPLPLFSYGGSNMLTCMIAIGLVLNVNMRRSRYNI